MQCPHCGRVLEETGIDRSGHLLYNQAICRGCYRLVARNPRIVPILLLLASVLWLGYCGVAVIGATGPHLADRGSLRSQR